jgi:ATP-dependent DNA helicase RecQ
MSTDARDGVVDPRVAAVLRQYWGYTSLRPLQAEAIAAGLMQRDSLVVMPTGGGKSLCYQIPPVVAGRLDIVISPLIALMKDQVDGLRQNGVPAAAVYSGQSLDEQRDIARAARAGELRLLLIAPERALKPRFLAFARELGVQSIAIDEAHCISHWGHDFRPEYRQLAKLREALPDCSLHAFTATATERVRGDIARQLGLREPTVLVGDFDRPNLVYRVEPRVDLDDQIQRVLDRHRDEAAIIYCITRRETEAISAVLAGGGVRAEHYHAGHGTGPAPPRRPGAASPASSST